MDKLQVSQSWCPLDGTCDRYLEISQKIADARDELQRLYYELDAHTLELYHNSGAPLAFALDREVHNADH